MWLSILKSEALCLTPGPHSRRAAIHTLSTTTKTTEKIPSTANGKMLSFLRDASAEINKLPEDNE